MKNEKCKKAVQHVIAPACKHKQALRVSNSFARGPAKGDCGGFDGDYTEVSIQKKLLGQFYLNL